MTPPPDDVLDLLTAYALDALEPEELVQVSELLEQQPDLYETLADLRATVQQLPIALPDAEPPPDLRQRTLDYAVGRTSRATVAAPQSPVVWLRRWLVVLSGALVAVLVVATLGWTQSLSAAGELARTRGELAQAQRALTELQDKQQQVAAVVGRANTLVDLSGTAGSGVVLRGSNGGAVVSANLPPLAQGRVYELWLIQGANAPLNGGTFTVDAQGNGFLALSPGQHITSADTFAVTEEATGGSPVPTTPVLIAGKIPTA